MTTSRGWWDVPFPGGPIWHPAKHWWAGPVSIIVALAAIVAFANMGHTSPPPRHPHPMPIHTTKGK